MGRNPLTPQVPAAFMANLSSALDRANGMLRLSGLSVRIRERRHSQWLSVYQVLPGGGTRERATRGYAAADPEAVERLYETVRAIAKQQPSFDWDALISCPRTNVRQNPAGPKSAKPSWPSNGARG